jgi:hypothetical protein
MDVVTSLVGDLNPPDTEPRRRPDQAARRAPLLLPDPIPDGPLKDLAAASAAQLGVLPDFLMARSL